MDGEGSRVEDVLDRLEALLARYENTDTVVAQNLPVTGRNLDRSLAQQANLIYRSRRLRDEIFGRPEMFGEPAYDILLDLYVAESENKLVSITSACIGSGVHQTTALRWLKVLQDAKYIVRFDDTDDKRRSYVRLTGEGIRVMQAFLRASSALECAPQKCSGSYLIEGTVSGAGRLLSS